MIKTGWDIGDIGKGKNQLFSRFSKFRVKEESFQLIAKVFLYKPWRNEMGEVWDLEPKAEETFKQYADIIGENESLFTKFNVYVYVYVYEEGELPLSSEVYKTIIKIINLLLDINLRATGLRGSYNPLGDKDVYFKHTDLNKKVKFNVNMDELAEELDKDLNQDDIDEENIDPNEEQEDPLCNIPLLKTLNKESQILQEAPYFNEFELLSPISSSPLLEAFFFGFSINFFCFVFI